MIEVAAGDWIRGDYSIE